MYHIYFCFFVIKLLSLLWRLIQKLRIMATISFISSKGGAGKSTLTWITATSLACDHGKKVCIIDADTQMSLYTSSLTMENLPFKVESVPLSGVYEAVRRIYNDYDVVFLDMPGILHTPDGNDAQISNFLFYVDVMLFPVKPSKFDLLSALSFVDTIKQVMNDRAAKGVPASVGVFINEAQNTLETREAVKIIEQISTKLNTPKWTRHISKSVTYARGVLDPVSILDPVKKSPPKIANEFRHFVNEVLKLV